MLLTMGLLLTSGPSNANPANCDKDMTEDQNFIRGLCSAHPGCALVFGLYDSCAEAKSFLNSLGSASKGGGGRITPESLNSALLDLGVPDPSLSDCTINFDRALCRQYLGIDKEPVVIYKEAPKPTHREELRAKIYALLNQAKKGKDGTAWRLAQTVLENCAASKDRSDREKTCNLAQENVDACNKEREDWRQQKADVIAEARKDDPNLGKSFSEAAGNLRKVDKTGLAAPTEDEWYSDKIRLLETMDLPACPYTLPGTSLIPKQALEEWSKGEGKQNEKIGKCDGLSREASLAIDNEEPEHAKSALGQFETTCAKLNGTYEGLVRLYKKRLAELETSQKRAALSRRGNAATDMFKQAIAKAEKAEQERREREVAAQANLATGSVDSSAELNGEWLGQQSGNRVRIKVQSDGVYVTPISNNSGQSSNGYLYRKNGQGSYRFDFDDSQHSVVQVLGPKRMRVTNSDGWADIFILQAAELSQRPASPGASAPAGRPIHNPCLSSSYFDGTGCRERNPVKGGYAR